MWLHFLSELHHAEVQAALKSRAVLFTGVGSGREDPELGLCVSTCVNAHILVLTFIVMCVHTHCLVSMHARLCELLVHDIHMPMHVPQLTCLHVCSHPHVHMHTHTCVYTYPCVCLYTTHVYVQRCLESDRCFLFYPRHPHWLGTADWNLFLSISLAGHSSALGRPRALKMSGLYIVTDIWAAS